jgi:hypothetical protein
MDSRFTAAVIIVGALAAWGAWYLGRAFSLWSRLRGDRIVTCPEDGKPATVHIDVALAVTSDKGSAPAALESCSRWAERGVCDQPCVHAAEAPESSAAAVVKAWAKGRQCVTCGGELADSRLAGHHIGLLEPSGMTREWVDVAADRLPLALATSLPLCWNCHVAATFRRLHPELVTDRDEAAVHVKNA